MFAWFEHRHEQRSVSAGFMLSIMVCLILGAGMLLAGNYLRQIWLSNNGITSAYRTNESIVPSAQRYFFKTQPLPNDASDSASEYIDDGGEDESVSPDDRNVAAESSQHELRTRVQQAIKELTP
jgi:hypothetical protein